MNDDELLGKRFFVVVLAVYLCWSTGGFWQLIAIGVLGWMAWGRDTKHPTPIDIVQFVLTPIQHDMMRLFGAMAKCDGKVTRSEVAAATAIMDSMGFTKEQHEAGVKAFTLGKAEVADITAICQALNSHCAGDPELQNGVISYAFALAFADGHISEAEAKHLRTVNEILCGNAWPLEEAISNARENSPYTILGIQHPCSLEEAKRCYKKKIAEFHPDRMNLKDIPNELREFAETRARLINGAWAQLEKDLAP